MPTFPARLRCLGTATLAAFLLYAPNAAAQAIQISAGASTLYGAAGGTVLMQTENTQTSVGAGLQGHRFGAGGALQRHTTNGTTTVGLQQMRADVPTDIFAPTHVLVGLGAGFMRTDAARDGELRGFAGFSSVNSGSPLFTTGDVEAPMLFSQWKQAISPDCQLVTTAIDFRQVLGLGSVGCAFGKETRWRVAGTAGGGPEGLYAAASVSLENARAHVQAAYIAAGSRLDRSTTTYAPVPEPTGANLSFDYRLTGSWTVSATHETFFLPTFSDAADPALSTPREGTSLNQAGFAYQHGHTGFSGDVLASSLRVPAVAAPIPASSPLPADSSNVSLAASFAHDFGAVRWTENVVRSTASSTGYGPSSETMATSSLAVRLNPHMLGSLSADVSSGHLTLAPGGELLLASASVRVDYELLYVANHPSAPFQQAMVVNAGLRLWHQVGFEVSSAVGPTGIVGYTFRFTTFGARAPRGGDANLGVHVGNSVLTGSVVDEGGIPISGAALLIDAHHLYTGADGTFSFRERHSSPHLLRVLPEEFLTPGSFIVTSAPGHVSSQPDGEVRPVRIVVSRHSSPPPVTSASARPEDRPAPLATVAQGSDRP